MRPRATMAFIHAFLAVQIALPLAYYARRGADPYDERFAWRMFSAERMAQCRPIFRIGEQGAPVQLGATFHEGWLEMARRGRRDVLEAMADRLCRDNPGEPVKLELTCAGPDKQPRQLSAGYWDLCRAHL